MQIMAECRVKIMTKEVFASEIINEFVGKKPSI